MARAGEPGVAVGLAWTPAGGEVLFIETTATPGDGRLTLTGHLGDVMKESAQAALTFIHSQARRLRIPDRAFRDQNLHIHVPAGAAPKDGPSAGVAIALSIASHLSGRPVRKGLAMTGEISLKGSVLPVGGVKEKVLAAHRRGLKEILLPRENRPDLADVPDEVKNRLRFHYVSDARQALALSLDGRAAASKLKPSPPARRRSPRSPARPRARKSPRRGAARTA
jgi:ATP-dependent Lon protease